MDDHLEESEGGDFDALEVVGVVSPRLLLLGLGLRGLVVVEDCVGGRVAGVGGGDDVVLQFPGLARDCGRGRKGFHSSALSEKPSACQSVQCAESN